MFKVGLTDQLDDHFDIIPLQTGPSKGKIVDSSVEDNCLLGGLIVDSLGPLHFSFSRASTMLPTVWIRQIICLIPVTRAQIRDQPSVVRI